MFSREITPKLREALGEDPVVFLRGPRQAGKTTLAGSLKDGRQYHTLDDLATLAAAKAAPLFTSAAPAVKYPNVRPQPPGQAPGGSGYTAAAVPHARAKGQRIHVRRPHQTTSHHAAP